MMPIVTHSNKILHPLFLVCLALLLCNDFWLKEEFSNVITGKLSDFTGLFIFPFFWSAFFPKYTRGIHIRQCYCLYGLKVLYLPLCYHGLMVLDYLSDG